MYTENTFAWWGFCLKVRPVGSETGREGNGMAWLLEKALVIVGVGLVAMSVWFAYRKANGSRSRARRSERRAVYVDTLSSLVVEGGGFPRLLRRRAGDPAFREVLLEYLRFLEGDERRYLLQMASALNLVDRYVRELHHPMKDVRVRAAEALTEFADPATIPSLVIAVTDPVPEVRIQAVAALARIKDARAVRPILVQLDREDEWAAHRITDSLSQFGRDAVEPLSRYVERSGRYVQLVIRALGQIGDYRAEPTLLASLDAPEKEVRIRAAAALGRTGTPVGIQDLVQAMRDPSWEVRTQAAKALGDVGDRLAIPVLRHALRDSSWWVRNNAAAALAHLPGGMEALRDALDDRDPYARDMAASMLLASGEAKKAMNLVEDDDPIEREKARALIRKLAQAGKGEYFRQAIRLGETLEPQAVWEAIDLDVIGGDDGPFLRE